MAALNPGAALRLADRLLEANERSYWEADEATLEALQAAREALEDRLEGLDGDERCGGLTDIRYFEEFDHEQHSRTYGAARWRG